MQSNSSNDTRNVIPRWHSLNAMAPWELESAQRLDRAVIVTPELYADELARWRAEGSLASAADIFSTGLTTSDRSLIWEGGLKLIGREKEVEERLIESVKREIAPKRDLRVFREKIASLEQNTGYLRSTIRLLKRRIIQYPRNAVLTLELSRHYAILGQNDQALNWLMRAYALAPNNRMILRALVQFHDVIGDLRSSLPYLWKSDGLKYDPLIQSAEVAAAEISGRGSKTASILKRKFKGLPTVSRSQSEAALALATLEHANGISERAVFKLVKAGLFNSTENAFAQGVWIGEKTTRTLMTRFPELKIQDDAFEARANIYFDAKEYKLAIGEAYKWSLDQPFQAHPLAFICNCAAIYTNDPSLGKKYADIIMSRHSNDWSAVNAALMVYNEIKSFDRAREALSILRRLADSSSVRSFVHAGSGLVYFSTGELEPARESYMEAIKLAKNANRRDLTFSAVAFYVLGEARFGHCAADELGTVILLLERILNKMDHPDRNHLAGLLDRVKYIISLKNDVDYLGNEIGAQQSLPRFTELPKMVDDL